MGRQSAAIAFVLVTTLLAGCVTDGGGRGTAGGADAFHAGVSAMLRGDLDEAVAQYSRALESAPTPEAQAQVHQARAATYYRMGEPDKALADADAVIRLRPDLADAYSLRGQILQAKGQPDLALNDLEIAVRLKPEARNYGNRGFGRMALGQLDAALEDFNEAIRLKPRYAEAYLGRGTYYLRNRDYRAAIGQFDQVIQLSPEHASAYNLRGNSYAYLGEYERSISDFDVAILFQPRYAEAFSNRGMMRYVQGDLKGAGVDFAQAIEIDPHRPIDIAFLHMARRKTGVEDRNEFARNASKLDQTKWPSPIVALYLGTVSPEQFRRMQEQATPEAQSALKCLVSFHLGYRHLLANETGKGRQLMRDAAGTCEERSIEGMIARRELSMANE